jgi:hypothetical protein
VSKISDGDIQRIIQQWMKEKPLVEIAGYFQITRQRVYPLISLFKEVEYYPVPKQSERKPQSIDERTEVLIRDVSIKQCRIYTSGEKRLGRCMGCISCIFSRNFLWVQNFSRKNLSHHN